MTETATGHDRDLPGFGLGGSNDAAVDGSDVAGVGLNEAIDELSGELDGIVHQTGHVTTSLRVHCCYRRGVVKIWVRTSSVTS